jgi:uncharacterized membrane protein
MVATQEGRSFMAELIAIGYPDEKTAEEAAALSRFGGTVLKTSLSRDAERELQDALLHAPA